MGLCKTSQWVEVINILFRCIHLYPKCNQCNQTQVTLKIMSRNIFLFNLDFGCFNKKYKFKNSLKCLKN